MRLAILTGVAMTIALGSGAAAQDAPPTTGPYLWAQQESDHVVLIATGTRHRTTGPNWAATVITVFDLPDFGQVRADATVEADCDLAVRRTDDLHLFPAADVDRPGARVTTVPGMAWEPPGPLDGPVMAFLCEGTVDRSRLRSSLSQHVTTWRAGG